MIETGTRGFEVSRGDRTGVRRKGQVERTGEVGANDATATIKRSDFNMGKNVPYVGDEVTLNLAIEAAKLPAAAS